MNNSDISRAVTKRGIRKEYRTLETDVWEWVLAESKRLGKLPTKVTIQKYAQKKYVDAGHCDFKASAGWYRRWGKRYKLKDSYSSVRECTSTGSACTSPENKVPDSSSSLQPNHGTGSCLSETLESFSIETDKLMSNIEMINSPSEFFDFSESAIDMADTGDVSMKNFMKELMDDFGRYFNESDNTDKGDKGVGKLNKKSCKYDKDFKDKVIAFISKHRIMEAAAKFKISPETISIWMKENKFQDQLTQIFIDESTSVNVERKIRNKEREFCEWLREKETDNVIVSKEEVKEKLSSLFALAWCGKSYWFAKYCHRYLHGKQPSRPIKINYSIQFQKLMVNYATRTSQIRTASVFNLARKQIFNWMKNALAKDVNSKKQTEEELYEWYDAKSLKPVGRMIRDKAKQLSNGNTALKNSYSWYYKWCAKNDITVKRNCDEEIVEWILAAYDRNVSVSHEDVQKKALETYSSNNEGSFKASTGWLLRFCRRYMNLLRRIPPLSASLPSACESSIKQVRERVLNLLNDNEINEDCYGVMDEILLKLKPGTNNKSQQKPLLRSCGTSNIQGTVILTCLSNGTILPPLLTLKDKYDVTSGFDRFSIIYQPNGIVDENIMQFWLANVWFNYVREPNLLLIDCFEPHTNENVKTKFDEHKSHLVIIPAGCSSKLNPLTQMISPQFQETIDEYCCKWFEENSLTWQIEGSNTSLSSEDIIDWVAKAYDSVNNTSMQENVRNVFKRMMIRL